MRIVRTWRGLSTIFCAALVAVAGCGQPTSGEPHAARSGSPSPFRVEDSYRAAQLGLRDPRWLAIAPDGDLYVTDRTQRVSVFSPALKLLRRFGAPGSAPGQFHFVSGDPAAPWELGANIAVGIKGVVAVADTGNYRVEEFDSSGHFLRQVGGFGPGRGGFVNPPGGVAFGGDGSLFVVEQGIDGRITKFTSTGAFAWRKAPDVRPGNLHLTMLDSHGRLVLVNDDAESVSYVSQDGHPVDGFDSGDAPVGCEAAVDRTGDMFMVGCGPSDPLYELDQRHHVVAILPRNRVAVATPPIPSPTGDYWALTYDHRLLRLRFTPPGG